MFIETSMPDQTPGDLEKVNDLMQIQVSKNSVLLSNKQTNKSSQSI